MLEPAGTGRLVCRFCCLRANGCVAICRRPKPAGRRGANYATLLVGATPLRKAETDRRIDAVLRLDTQLYARAKAGALPKLLLGSTLISGRLEDSQPLEDAIERE